jgi:hypothetical protein
VAEVVGDLGGELFEDLVVDRRAVEDGELGVGTEVALDADAVDGEQERLVAGGGGEYSYAWVGIGGMGGVGADAADG